MLTECAGYRLWRWVGSPACRSGRPELTRSSAWKYALRRTASAAAIAIMIRTQLDSEAEHLVFEGQTRFSLFVERLDDTMR